MVAYVALLADILVDRLMLDVAVYLALHHRATVVVFNVPFPSRLRHGRTLRESLLPEVLDSVVVGVGQKIVEVDFLSMVLQPVHQPRPISLHLLRGRDCQEHNLGELLGVEGAEDAAAKYDGPLVFLLFNDNHRLVDAVHDQPHDVGPRHPRELLGDDVLEVDEVPHALESPRAVSEFAALTYRS